MSVHNLWIFVLLALLVRSQDADEKSGPTVTGTKLDSSMQEFVWCGEDNDVVLLHTAGGNVYRSQDRGATFKQITKRMQKAAEELVEDAEEIGEVANILRSEADDKLVFFVGTKGVSWVSQDCGARMRALNKGFVSTVVRSHPVERNWILAGSRQTCESDAKKSKKSSCIPGAFVLYLTQDLGQTWKKIARNVHRFDWPLNQMQISAGVPTSRVFALMSGKQQNPLVCTDDFFGNTTVLVPDALDFKRRAAYLFATQKLQGSGEVTLLVASVANGFSKFVPAVFPQRTLKSHKFHILSTSAVAVFILVTHRADSPIGDLYVSDSTGVRYTLSLKHVLRTPIYGADFSMIKGLEGVYIANALNERAAKAFGKQSEEDDTEEEKWVDDEREESSERRSADSGKRKKLSESLIKDNIHSYITFNKGGSWRYIMPPKVDSKGQQVHCQGDGKCALHLYIYKDTTLPLYSHQNAHGLILATGNTGKALLHKQFTRNVYLSRDGGLTWREIAKGPHVYDLADHGGLIVLSKLAGSGRKGVSVKYSWNEGTSWESLQISPKNGTMEDVFTEPDSSTQHFLARVDSYRETEGGLTKYTSIYNINFEGLHKRQCRGEDKPGTPGSDYEAWSPYDGRQGDNKCLLGRRISYSRRKRDSDCFNGIKFERPLSTENCDCTEEDYECDFGFARKDLLSNGPCIALSNISYSPPDQCPAAGYYEVSSGYRKVSGDSCQNGVKHEPITIPCSTSLMSSSGLIILALLGIIVVLLVVVGFNYGSLELLKKKVGAGLKAVGKFRDVKYGKVDTDEEMVISSGKSDAEAEK